MELKLEPEPEPEPEPVMELKPVLELKLELGIELWKDTSWMKAVQVIVLSMGMEKQMVDWLGSHNSLVRAVEQVLVLVLDMPRLRVLRKLGM